MYRCGVLLKNGERLKPKNFDSKDQCEEWLLGLMDEYDLKKSVIVNKDNMKERYTENF